MALITELALRVKGNTKGNMGVMALIMELALLVKGNTKGNMGVAWR